MTSLYVLHGRRPVIEPDPNAWVEWMSATDRLLWATELHATTRIARLQTYFTGTPSPSPTGPCLFATAYLEGPAVDALVEVGTRRLYTTWEDAEAGHHAVADALVARSRPSR